ncbi:MAG: hypothetical protein D0531_08830 [Methylococcales bacterium]|nr:MAG: hypothetical protein D0531_08830 [Methylococcales bacterium]
MLDVNQDEVFGILKRSVLIFLSLIAISLKQIRIPLARNGRINIIYSHFRAFDVPLGRHVGHS